MRKHAYLILAHNNFYILEKLIELLDDKRNDIFIHIDKKVKKFDFNFFTNLVKHSNIKFIDRVNIGWGAFSGIKAELKLFKEAYKNGYEYYHLISGVDLPIKTQDYIHKFFLENRGKEFLTYLKPEFTKNNKIIERVNKYYFLQEFGRGNYITKFFSDLLINFQNLLKLNRYNNKLDICYGSNWATLTHEAVKEILKEEEWIYRTFKHTRCCDEVYKQTILVNNPMFKKKLYLYEYNDAHISYNMRHIDWKRGGPYVFRINDYEELMGVRSIFARKFDENIDIDIVNKIYQTIKVNSNNV